MSSDALTITQAHRTALRHIARGESLTQDLAESLGALYLHELVDDVPVEGQPFRTPALTELGRRLLEVHESMPETRRVERPRLESRGIPQRWTGDGESYVREPYIVTPVPDGRIVIHHATVEQLDEEVAAVRDVLALLEWLQHERAVLAQDDPS